MNDNNSKIIDAHVHVGLLGKEWPNLGRMSDSYQKSLTFKIFLLYAGIEADKISDKLLFETALKTISECGLDKIVCLALDPVYRIDGSREESASNFWVDNEYIIKLRSEEDKVLFGASVHPYDKDFKSRVKKCVNDGAVLLKWLPSAQQINLAETKTVEAMEFLATAKDGKPLPLLLHIGPEYAIPSTDEKTFTYDFLCWSKLEGIRNWFRFGKKWHIPEVNKIERNILRAMEAGSVIIFAHCGLPYFAWKFFKFLEHSDLEFVQKYLEMNDLNDYKGRCLADVSACSTPFRKSYFDDILELPEDYLLFGSDYPTPVFEIFADKGEMNRDFKAMLKGHLERIIIPQDNLLDVNYVQLKEAFPGHPMFTNFSKLV